MATLLDQGSVVIENWFHLGFKFGIKREFLDEIKYGRFTQYIMEYLYTKKPQLTVGAFYEVIKKLGRKDVLKKLEKFIAGELARLISDTVMLRQLELRSKNHLSLN